MKTSEAVKVLKQAIAALQSTHPAKVEVAIRLIQAVIAGLQIRRHK